MKLKPLTRFWHKSISRRLIWGIAFTHAILMTLFVFDVVSRQRTFLLNQSRTQAVRLAETLAADTTDWILTTDLTAINKALSARRGLMRLNYAMILNMNSQVLSYTGRADIDSFTNDSLSHRLLSQTGKTLILDNPVGIEVAAPVFTNNRQIGWARLGIDHSGIADDLATVTRNGLFYTLVAIVIGTLFAWRVARGLTSAIRHMTKAAHAVEQGQRNVNFQLERADELGLLSYDFDAIMKTLAENERALKDYQEHLEQLVADRTLELQQANETLTEVNLTIARKRDKLEKAYEQLQQLQEQLIESEKFSALGTLVAGISHEINTPLGVSYTGVSCLHDKHVELRALLQTNALSKTALTDFFSQSETMLDLIIKNMQRATQLVSSFKKIAVDQTIDNLSDFSLNDYIQDTLYGLSDKLKSQSVGVNCDIAADIVIHSDPGLFAQLIKHLVNNSLVHGFDGQNNKTPSQIQISAQHQKDQLLLTYQDNGVGIDELHIKKIYDPFYTTKMSTGGGGLGLHVVYNIITQRLKGTIKCTSKPNAGVCFSIVLPLLEGRG